MHIALHEITVGFDELVAVDAVSLEFNSGEIHAIVGENGAGKTTLMNVLYGMLSPSSGYLTIDGQSHTWNSTRDAIAHGIAMVHQHFMLQDSMSVLENVVLCAEPLKRFSRVDFANARRQLAQIGNKHGITVPLESQVGELSLGQRQLVEILKALYRNADTLILDEPTAVLTPQETSQLFAILRQFRIQGKAIVVITHKLDEVFAVADKVSVMRAGKLISSSSLAATSQAVVARDIIGRQLPPARLRKTQSAGKPVLEVHNLSAHRHAQLLGPLSFSVHSGEVVGVAGVSGNGQSELVRCLVGLQAVISGEVTLCGHNITAAGVAARRHVGMAYIPEDRQQTGLALAARVADNAAIGHMHQREFHVGPWRSWQAMQAHARLLIDRYRIKTPGTSTRTAELSGGNQQKLVVGRELSRYKPLLIAENPTWGVDIGAIDFIHRELMQLRDAGHAILLVSSEIDEILSLSDRILVMFEGQIAGVINGDSADRQTVGALMTSRQPGARNIATA